MAEVLEQHDFSSGHGNGKYPWSEWADGRTWKVVRGRDFEVDPKVMQGQVKVRGGKEGRLTATNVRGDELTFTFQREGETEDEFRARTKPGRG